MSNTVNYNMCLCTINILKHFFHRKTIIDDTILY